MAKKHFVIEFNRDPVKEGKIGAPTSGAAEAEVVRRMTGSDVETLRAAAANRAATATKPEAPAAKV